MPEDGDIGEGSGEGEGKTAMRQVSIIISCDFKSRQFTFAICDKMPKKVPNGRILCQSRLIRIRNHIDKFIANFLSMRSLEGPLRKATLLDQTEGFFSPNKQNQELVQSKVCQKALI